MFKRASRILPLDDEDSELDSAMHEADTKLSVSSAKPNKIEYSNSQEIEMENDYDANYEYKERYTIDSADDNDVDTSRNNHRMSFSKSISNHGMNTDNNGILTQQTNGRQYASEVEMAPVMYNQQPTIDIPVDGVALNNLSETTPTENMQPLRKQSFNGMVTGNHGEEAMAAVASSPTRKKKSVLSVALAAEAGYVHEGELVPLSAAGKKQSLLAAQQAAHAGVARKASTQFLMEAAEMTLPPAPIVFLDFDAFKTYGAIPRYSARSHMYLSLQDIDRNNSLVIFVSHRWLRASSDQGESHPDNATHDHYHMCVQGISAVLANFAPDVERCYLWLDYSCLEQGGDSLAARTVDLCGVMEAADCVFTPVASEWPGSSSRQSIEDRYRDYDAPEWTDVANGYINRAWCRLEMFAAGNVPFEISEDRLSLFKNGFHLLLSLNIRPHIVYGTSEMKASKPPFLLPPLWNNDFDKYDPRQGHVSNAADMASIVNLLQQLGPIVKYPIGWTGGYDDQNRPVGSAIFTFESGSIYEGTMKEGKMDGQGSMRYSTGNYYTGEWCEGKRHGSGTFRSLNGTEYHGEYSGNKKHGLGLYIYASGASYDGEWSEDKMNGKGLFRYADGSSYEGDFVLDSLSGQGRYLYTNGNVYEGTWVDGRREGKGVCQYSSGAVYEGDWKDDKKEGTGTYTSADKDVYTGGFLNDERHGYATARMCTPDGGVYEGELLDGKLHGRGKYIWTNHNSYDGEWLDGSMTGLGCYVWHEAKVRYEGDFENGIRNGKGKFYYPDGSVYEGDFVRDKMQGEGVYKYADGSVYAGSWVDGDRAGSGLFTDSGGNVYQGSFAEGKMNGFGRLKYANGDSYEGYWVDNKKHGEGRQIFADGRTLEGDFSAGKLVLKRAVEFAATTEGKLAPPTIMAEGGDGA